jgi:dTDP-glucose 4,6-dehydratase
MVTGGARFHGLCLHPFPEKLIPLMILNALDGKPFPIYGDGMQVRDWLYVEDHWIEKGRLGEIYNIAGNASVANIDVVHRILEITGRPASLIRHVTDRHAHDRRHALSSTKLQRDTGWDSTNRF